MRQKTLGLALTLCTVILAGPAAAQSGAPTPGPETQELVVLLRHGMVDPDEVVDAINANRAAPGGLSEGNPMAARKVIREPARHRLAESILHNPEGLEARKFRYIVLRFPDHVNLDAIMTALSNNPNVQSVGPNLAFTLHATVNGPWVGTGEPGEDPSLTQWGLHALNLVEALGRVRGRSILGFIDEGIEVGHEDLRPSHLDSGRPVFDGGSFRAHLSRDLASTSTDCSVDELDPTNPPGNIDETPGHGSHTTGIAAANGSNQVGVAAACLDCSALVTKVSPAPDSGPEPPQKIVMDRALDALDFHRRHGAQVVNMSFGVEVVMGCENPNNTILFICDGLSLAEQRDIVMVASSGNNSRFNVDHPAMDPRTIAVGGLMSDPLLGPVLWNDGCFPGCGSNVGPEQTLMAPAKAVLSSVYSGHNHISTCGDDTFTLDAPAGTSGGYGLCTGTSMAAPFVTGSAGLVRTANPHLGKEAVRDALVSTASIPGAKDPQLGHGTPDAEAAVVRSFGHVARRPLANRLVPFFELHSSPPGNAPRAETHVNTTVPQVASSLLLDDVRLFNTAGSTTPLYGAFPGFCTTPAADCCPVNQPCCVGQGDECVGKFLVEADTRPGADVYVFTADVPPSPTSPPLVPLYRLRYESDLSDNCESPQNDPVSTIRDFAFATSTVEVEAYLGGVNLNGTVFKYKVDSIEGYVYEHCDFGCPPGVVALHRLYNSARHDTVIVPTSAVAAMIAQGYFPPTDPNLPEIVGFGFPNVDSDLDGLIDGFERLIGTNPGDADSDDDGISDGQELLVYDRSNPDPALRGYGDPCSNGCPIFADGFETGNTLFWTSIVP